MKIEAIALREIHMRIKAPFETSFGIVQNRRILLVETIADGVSGWGEVTASETPGYNAETTETAWHVLSDFIAPSVIGKNILDASEFPALMSHIRGHEMAINIKLGHVGGHTESAASEDVCRHHSIPVWCGGMLESGIGRAHNIAMSTLERFHSL